MQLLIVELIAFIKAKTFALAIVTFNLRNTLFLLIQRSRFRAIVVNQQKNTYKREIKLEIKTHTNLKKKNVFDKQSSHFKMNVKREREEIQSDREMHLLSRTR